MLKAAVIGVGHLGKFHAQKYSIIENAELVGVADISNKRAEAVASDLGVRAFTDYKELIGKVDIASIVVPTQDHFSVAKDFIEAGTHVLIEKPITRTLEEADALISIADRKGLVLQVGHLERFNPAITVSDPYFKDPLFIEANRISPFPQRGADVDVVLDLMIHDIDLTLRMVGQEPKWIHAVGVPVVTSRVDIANARLEFESGCVANLTASRISIKSERKIRIFQRDAYFSIDCGKKTVNMARKTPPGESGIPGIEAKELIVGDHDALEQEIRSFIESVEKKKAPLVSGVDGRRALAAALQINTNIAAHLGNWFDHQDSDLT